VARQEDVQTATLRDKGHGMLKHFFHEVKTRVVYEFDQHGAALRKTYQATQARVEEF